MIKAVIFDCFGVLAGEGWTPFKEKYFINNPELLAKASVLNVDLDIGKITFPEFVKQVSILAGTDYDYTYKFIDDTPVNEDLLDFIEKELKGKFKVGMLSNAGENWLDTMFTKQQNQLFDQAVLSYEIGYAKPDAQAYQYITEKLDVSPQEAVFIDDQHKYIVGAEEFGLRTIHHKDNKETIKRLEQLLI